MKLEEKIRTKLPVRGFSNETIINNRGLIGTVIDSTIIELVKTITISDDEEHLRRCGKCGRLKE